jgi:transcription elongation factor Elf1
MRLPLCPYCGSKDLSETKIKKNSIQLMICCYNCGRMFFDYQIIYDKNNIICNDVFIMDLIDKIRHGILELKIKEKETKNVI